MNRIAPETWHQLARTLPAGELLTARLAAPEVTKRLQAAVDAEGKRHFLIKLNPDEKELRDADSRGVVVFTRELVLNGGTPGRYLDMICQDINGHGAFDLIGGELATVLASGNATPATATTQVLARWRRFFGRMPLQMLSLEAQLGLFAELWFLIFRLSLHCSNEEAVKRWRGPYGARHDFEWPGKSVEVKATLSSRGRIHKINGLDQLAPPEKGMLSLFSMRLREEAGASNSLPVLIEKGRTLLDNTPEALSRWEASLVAAGYSPEHEEEYAKLKLRVVDEMLLAVRDDFPRLTPTSFRDGLPMGVESVGYEIRLDGFAHLALTDERRIKGALS